MVPELGGGLALAIRGHHHIPEPSLARVTPLKCECSQTPAARNVRREACVLKSGRPEFGMNYDRREEGGKVMRSLIKATGALPRSPEFGERVHDAN